MNRTILTALCAAFLACGMQARDFRGSEPDFINSYCILTSDSTYKQLPKESGTIKKHENKVSKWSKLASIASDAAVGAGAIVGATAGSAGSAIAGLRTMGTAAGVGSIADAAGALAGANGMDIVFEGKNSPYIHKKGEPISILVKYESNDYDPTDIYRIARLDSKKNERRIQWLEFNSSLLGTKETTDKGYIYFAGRKFGEQSYILELPEDIKPGDYGIFYLGVEAATAIPVATFCIK